MKCIVAELISCSFLLCLSISCGGGEGKGCTSRFMSVDRMDKLLNNEGSLEPNENYQAIFPGARFTCSGNVTAWMFSALWVEEGLLPEIQIWRPVGGNGTYTRVAGTIVGTKRSRTKLYSYTLSSPLTFQAGDILGYYQPRIQHSQLRFYQEKNARGGIAGYYFNGISSATDLYLPWGVRSEAFQIMIRPITDSPDCVSGFMSEERMRLLLDLDSTSFTITTNSRQQISPEMRITCDGVITKWIVGADWSSRDGDSQFPELQIWRNFGNTYQKISGTSVFFAFNMQPNRIYEYSSFTPIPVKSGDILGIFFPLSSNLRIRIRSETHTGSPVQYYKNAEDSNTSPFDVIDVSDDSLSLESSPYHPLISVEIVPTTQVTFATPTKSTTSIALSYGYSTLKLVIQDTTVDTTQTETLEITVQTTPLLSDVRQTSTAKVSPALYIGVGLASVGVALISLTILLLSLGLCYYRQRARKNRRKEVVRHSNESNGAPIANGEDGKYDYPSLSSSDSTPSNVTVSANLAYGFLQN